MSAGTLLSFRRKLDTLTMSQQSIQTLSGWMIAHHGEMRGIVAALPAGIALGRQFAFERTCLRRCGETTEDDRQQRSHGKPPRQLPQREAVASTDQPARGNRGRNRATAGHRSTNPAHPADVVAPRIRSPRDPEVGLRL